MAPKNTDPARAAESNLGYILSVTGALHAIALLFVCVRTYTRIAIVQAFGKDDALVLASITCVLFGGMVTYIMAAQHGLGHHIDTMERSDYHEYLKMTFIQAIVSSIGGMCLLKLSIGFSLLRLKPPVCYSRLLWGLIGFVGVYTLVSWCEWAAFCKPIAGFWNKDLKPTCLPQRLHTGFALMNTTCNIFTDIAFATIPVPLIQALQMKRRTRIYLICILSLGYVAVVAGIIKTVVQNTKRGDPDQSFRNDIQFWGFIQVNLGIIAACAPSLRPLVGGMLKLPTTEASGSGSNNYEMGNNIRVKSRIRISSHTLRHHHGWERADSDTDLDPAFFGGQTNITRVKGKEVSIGD